LLQSTIAQCSKAAKWWLARVRSSAIFDVFPAEKAGFSNRISTGNGDDEAGAGHRQAKAAAGAIIHHAAGACAAQRRRGWQLALPAPSKASRPILVIEP